MPVDKRTTKLVRSIKTDFGRRKAHGVSHRSNYVRIHGIQSFFVFVHSTEGRVELKKTSVKKPNLLI